MKASEFVAMCHQMNIDPAIALECDAVVAALKARSPVAVWAALTNNF